MMLLPRLLSSFKQLIGPLGMLPRARFSFYGDNTPSTAFVGEEDAMKILQDANPSLACGPDGLPMALFKAFSRILAPVLASVFNNCINTATFP